MRGVAVVALLGMLAFPVAADGRPPATVEAARDLITVDDDPLELSVVFTSRKIERQRQGLLRTVPFDVFLRAFVEKKSGRTQFQVYVTDTYHSVLWTRWMVANFEGVDGVRQARIQKIARIRGSCFRRDCVRNETVGFAVPEADLRAAVARGRDWSFRLKGQDGTNRNEVMSATEIGGMLAAVDRWRATQRFRPL
jgi:hypothetical protein